MATSSTPGSTSGGPTTPPRRRSTEWRSGRTRCSKSLPPNRFTRLLAASEIAIGAALLAPVVPAAVAGAALTGFSGALLGLYVRTPGLRKPGSVWPTHQGIGISKDIWMLGIGLGLLAGSCGRRAAS